VRPVRTILPQRISRAATTEVRTLAVALPPKYGP